jgi:hypothetical protein
MSEQVMIDRELLERLSVPKPDAKGWTTWHSSTAYTAAKELRAVLDAQPVSAQPAGDLPTYHLQWREIGESDWASRDLAWYQNCQKSAECDTRIVAALQSRAVVMPERKIESVRNGYRGLGRAEGWNACLDEVARLNGKGGM